jgi:hypothetical protein
MIVLFFCFASLLLVLCFSAKNTLTQLVFAMVVMILKINYIKYKHKL